MAMLQNAWLCSKMEFINMAGNLSLNYVIHRVGTDTYEQSFMTLIQIRKPNYFRREQINSQFF